MPNKKVPNEIAGQELCEASRARTARLLSLLEEIGVNGIASVSNTDRFRLLAHHLFTAHGRTELSQFGTVSNNSPTAVDSTEEVNIPGIDTPEEDVGSHVRIGMSEVAGLFDEEDTSSEQ